MSGKPGDAAKAFAMMAPEDAIVRREGLPDPAKLAAAGVKTREVLDWLELRAPAPPAPEHHIDDPQLRREALENERAEHRARINALRRQFAGRSEKGREDFSLANRYRQHDRER